MNPREERRLLLARHTTLIWQLIDSLILFTLFLTKQMKYVHIYIWEGSRGRDPGRLMQVVPATGLNKHGNGIGKVFSLQLVTAVHSSAWTLTIAPRAMKPDVLASIRKYKWGEKCHRWLRNFVQSRTESRQKKKKRRETGQDESLHKRDFPLQTNDLDARQCLAFAAATPWYEQKLSEQHLKVSKLVTYLWISGWTPEGSVVRKN